MERGEGREGEGGFTGIKVSDRRGLKVRSRKMADFRLHRILEICEGHNVMAPLGNTHDHTPREHT